jgi:hypothetical protein
METEKNEKTIERKPREKRKKPSDSERFFKLLHTIFHVCELAGFEVKGRICLLDKRTGKEWK